MAAVVRRICLHGGSIRLGPQCFVWGDPYTRSLSFELVSVNVALIGGLTWKLSRQEYRWIADAMFKEGLRGAMIRRKAGRQPYLVIMGKPGLLCEKGEGAERTRIQH